MQLIEGEIRQIAKDTFTTARRRLSKKSGSECYISTIDAVCKVLEKKRRENPKAIRKTFSPELSAAYLAAFSTGLMGFGLDVKDQRSSLFPSDWLDKDNKRNPNRLLASMFSLMSNQILGIITLVEKGLEMSARPLMRTMIEMLTLMCVITADREKMSYYSTSNDKDHERMIWHRHFSPKRLNQAFTEIEKRLDRKGALPEEFEEWRRDTYAFYTETVHPTFLVSSVGAYAASLHNTDMLDYALLGSPSVGSGSLLYDLALNVAYCLHIFTQIITEIHGRPFPIRNSLFCAGAALYIALSNTIKLLNERAE